MRRVCAWCTTVLYEGDHPNVETTHTICPPCVEVHFPSVALMKARLATVPA